MFSIMSYIKLDGRYTRANGYHFVLLNHLWHGEKVSMPHYLLYSMNANVKDKSKNSQGDHALHQGLMVFIYDLLKAKKIAHSLSLNSESKDDEIDDDFSEGFNSESDSMSEMKSSADKKGKQKMSS